MPEKFALLVAAQHLLPLCVVCAPAKWTPIIAKWMEKGKRYFQWEYENKFAKYMQTRITSVFEIIRQLAFRARSMHI